MPAFTFTDPSGKQYTVNGPAGATADQAFAILQQQLKGQQQPAAPAPGTISSTLSPDQVMPADAQAPPGQVLSDLKGMGRGMLNAMSDMTTGKPAFTPQGGLPETLGSLAAPFPGPPEGAAASAAGGTLDKLANAQPGQTVGAALGNKFMQMVEATVSRLPGGEMIANSMHRWEQNLGDRLSTIVDNLRGGRSADAEDAGQMLNQSLAKASDRIKTAAGAQFDKIDQTIPLGTKITATNLVNTLDNLTAIPLGGENLGQQLVDPRLVQLKTGLEKDIAAGGGSGALPIDILRWYKTKIGAMIDWDNPLAGVQNGALKQVYSALNKDIMDGAAQVNPKLAPMIAKANADYQVAAAQMDNLSSVINKAGGPDTIFTSLMSSTKDGSIPLRRVLVQLSPTDKQLLAAAQLRRMGLANPGVQGAAGGAFSADTFLTNWNRMNPDAKEALFGRLPSDYASQITQLAKNVETLKNYSRVMPNWSGTTRALIWAGDLNTALVSVLTGHPQVAAGVAAAGGGNALLASALTNPKTVGWLVKQTQPALWMAGKASTVSAASSRQ